MQRYLRPITMLSALLLIFVDTFGLGAFRLVEDAWTLLHIGFGGYIIGHSTEKIIPKIQEVMNKRS